MASFVKPGKASDLRSGLSKWELDELTKERRKRLSKREVRREIFADRLRCPLCFCLPCAIIAFILLILMGVYIVHPYRVGRTLTKTQCRYNRTEFQPTWKGYCSHRSNQFPCFKIFVNFNTSTVKNAEAVLIENEQALVHCNKCSYNGGRSDMFGKHSTCSWNSDLPPALCYAEYFRGFASVNATYPCYYDSSNIKDVVNMLKVSTAEAALAIFIPIFLLLLWFLGFSVLAYDRYKRRVLDGQILLERHKDTNGKSKVKNGAPKTFTLKAVGRASVDMGAETSFNGETENLTTMTSAPQVTSQATTPKIKRKKKLPCCKSHFQFNYLDEGIVLEDKPISPISEQPLSFNYLTIDTSPKCDCNHVEGIDVLPHLGDQYQTRSPSYLYESSQRRPGKILRYLPESFV